MSGRWIPLIVVGVVAVAGVAGYKGGQMGYRAEAAKVRAREQAEVAARQARINAAYKALPRLEDYRRNLRESPGDQMQSYYNYMVAKYEGTTLPCGDKWASFSAGFGPLRPTCIRGHVFQETGNGTLADAN